MLPDRDRLELRRPDRGRKLTSHGGRHGQATLVMLKLRTESMAVQNMDLIEGIEATLERSRHESDFPPGLQLGITGSAAVGADMLFAAEESIHNTEWTTVALVVVILLLVYRAPGLVLVPLVTIFASLELSTGLIALLARLGQRVEWFDFQVFRTTKIFIIVVLFGAATDYCLFLVARYREELQHGLTPPEALSGGPGQRRPCRNGQRHDHHPRPGDDDLRRVRQISLRRADHRLVADRGPGGLPDAGPRLAAGRRTDDLLAAGHAMPAGFE